MNNLTTLQAVRSYLGIVPTVQDTFINALIPRASVQIQHYCSQEFPTKTYTNHKMNGTGTTRIILPGPPILSVSAVQVLNTVIPPSPDGMTQPGYAFQDHMLYILPGLYGSTFTPNSYGGAFAGVTRFDAGINNVQVSWVGGYQDSETDFVPSNGIVAPVSGGTPAVDLGVAYTANGAALTQVGSGPVAGQYAFSDGVYTFNTTDFNQQVTMNYYYIPSPVEQAAIEMIGLKLKQRDNIGIKSKTLGGETVTYTDMSITPSIAAMLLPFTRKSYS